MDAFSNRPVARAMNPLFPIRIYAETSTNCMLDDPGNSSGSALPANHVTASGVRSLSSLTAINAAFLQLSAVNPSTRFCEPAGRGRPGHAFKTVARVIECHELGGQSWRNDHIASIGANCFGQRSCNTAVVVVQRTNSQIRL
jgi:hypothetical protein